VRSSAFDLPIQLAMREAREVQNLRLFHGICLGNRAQRLRESMPPLASLSGQLLPNASLPANSVLDFTRKTTWEAAAVLTEFGKMSSAAAATVSGRKKLCSAATVGHIFRIPACHEAATCESGTFTTSAATATAVVFPNKLCDATAAGDNFFRPVTSEATDTINLFHG